MKQILLATHNPAKIQRFKERLAVENLNFQTLLELGLTVNEPDETGENEWENAKIKAKAYYLATGLSALSEDTGFYFSSLNKDSQPGKDVQRSAGVIPDDSDEIRFKKMTDFYINIANSIRGNAEAYFLDEYCLYDGQKYYRASGTREVIVTNKVNQIDVHFPLCSLYKVKSLNKHYQNLSEDEMKEFLSPSIDSARAMLQKFTLSPLK